MICDATIENMNRMVLLKCSECGKESFTTCLDRIGEKCGADFRK